MSPYPHGLNKPQLYPVSHHEDTLDLVCINELGQIAEYGTLHRNTVS